MRLFNLLVRRHNQKQEDEQYNHASILAEIRNTQAQETKDLVEPEDLLGIPRKRPNQQDLETKMINAFATIKALNNA